MKAFSINNNSLALTNLPLPIPNDTEVLIKVEAIGINRADLFQVKGMYKAPMGSSEIPGLEVAGTIIAVGSKVTDYNAGDKVCALLSGGGYAEYTVAEASLIFPAPPRLNMVQAAALPEALFTVWLNLFEKAKLKTNETLLIHSATSGIGVMAIKIAKAFNIKVIATCSKDVKKENCLELGADYVINYKTQDLINEVKSITNGKGVDVILDILGGEYMAKNISCMNYEGRIVNIALMQGKDAEINLAPVLLKNLTIMGSTLRSQPLSVKKKIANQIKKELWPLLEQGKIEPHIDSTFAFKDASLAHDYMEKSQHTGKIILEIK
jgi:NADPH2:quinone reductase